MKSGLTLILTMALGGTALAAPPDLAVKVDAYLDHAFVADGPGVAANIVDDGKIVYHGARGMADVEEGVPLRPDSRFRLGSITKQFAAAMMMKLIEEGRVSLDDPLNRYVSDFPRGDSITIRQLLNHTSGIRSYTSIAELMTEAAANRDLSTDEMIARFRDLDPDFEPGSRFAYNNSGYVLVGAVIEAVTGKSWHEAVREELLLPHGIEGIVYMGAEDSDPELVGGYSIFADQVIRAQKIHGSVPHAAGALSGDVESVWQWYAALFGNEIVGEESLAAMTTPTKTGDGEEVPYGFGLGMGEILDRRVVGHGGGIFGFQADSKYLPDEDLFVAVFANSDQSAVSPGAVTARLVHLSLGREVPLLEKQAFDEEALSPFLGRYRFGEDYRDFFIRDGKLFTRRKDNAEVEAYAAGDGTYFYGPGSMTFFRLAHADGEPVMRFHSGGAEEPDIGTHAGEIVEEACIGLSEAQRAAIVGVYRFPFGDLTIAESGAGGVSAQLSGQPSIDLDARSATELLARRVGARLVFEVEDGQAKAVTLYQGGQEATAPRTD
ncbi:serine hydrolase domain-containing protein [Sphingomicrobium lutaoense]|uniref:CubicO group peptidase (Beta-lactamase class C family) n=1 Tax=Sphingomicrobium lutaoense TaxID=515949 RepID=A0A839YZ52_9SPHN|nr:serine hydrolase domain-containing protein [Sphingomicrobium lutaoense]MBB3763598.1 CubicO group peptidase (beta-lactamase class C family) [Sphingomicrobium lutaoense]